MVSWAVWVVKLAGIIEGTGQGKGSDPGVRQNGQTGSEHGFSSLVGSAKCHRGPVRLEDEDGNPKAHGIRSTSIVRSLDITRFANGVR